MKLKLSDLYKDFIGAAKSVNDGDTYRKTSYQAQKITNCTPCECKVLWKNYHQTKSLRVWVKVSVYIKLLSDGINSLPRTWSPQIEGESLPLKEGERETTLTNSIPNMLKETKIPLIKIGIKAYLKQSYHDPDNLRSCQRAMNKAMVSKVHSENLKNTKFLILSFCGVSISFLGFLWGRLTKK